MTTWVQAGTCSQRSEVRPVGLPLAKIRKVVSGGQTGVDRAALDAALAAGLEIGGWCPRGRRAEDGLIPLCYPLRETPSRDYRQRTRWNVRDSDGTLIFTWGPPTGGTALTWKTASRLQRPVFLAELSQDPAVLAGQIDRWATQHRLHILNVAGPRSSQAPQAAEYVRTVLLRWWSVPEIAKSPPRG